MYTGIYAYVENLNSLYWNSYQDYKEATMMSSKGNIFHITGLCVGNSPVTGEFPAQRPVTSSFDFFICTWIRMVICNHHAHYEAIVMTKKQTDVLRWCRDHQCQIKQFKMV